MPSMYGLSSGIDTKKIIKDLKEVEKQPIKRLQKQKEETGLENKVLQELQRVAKNLEMRAKVLFGFEAKYQAKKLTSDGSGAIKGSASKRAENNEYEIEVEGLATKLTIGSRNIKPSEKIPSGNIVFGDKKKRFKGGSLDDFKRFLNQNYSEFLSVRKIKVSSDAEKLVIESKQSGKKGVFDVKDPHEILKNLGIFDPNSKSKSTQNKKKKPNPSSKPEIKEEFASILFENMKMRILSGGPSEISLDQKALSLDKKAARELLSSPPKKKDANIKFLRFNVNHQPAPPLEEDTAPLRLNFGPTRSINIKGVVLNTYNSNRERSKEEPIIKEIDYGIMLTSPVGVSKKISLKDKSSLQEISVKGDVSAIGFYTKNTRVSFINPTWVYHKTPPSSPTPEEDTQADNPDGVNSEQQAKFPNLIKPGQDARVKVDGVELERDKNKGIDDIIDGVTLDLLKNTDGPVKVNILGDYEEAKKQILSFVDAYNKLLEFTQENSKADELANDTGKFDSDAKLKGKTGVLITNLAVRNLINGLKRRTSNAYPAFREPQLKVSAMLGISTGEIGANWQEISKGYLQVDQGLLVKRLEESPVSVKEFFGSDTNQDLKIDNGLAFKLYTFLKPYTQNYGRGIIYTNISTNKEKIRQLGEQITKVEEKANRYEDRLKRQFGAMESVIQRQKAIGGQIRNRFNTSDK